MAKQSMEALKAEILKEVDEKIKDEENRREKSIDDVKKEIETVKSNYVKRFDKVDEKLDKILDRFVDLLKSGKLTNQISVPAPTQVSSPDKKGVHLQYWQLITGAIVSLLTSGTAGAIISKLIK